MAICRACGRETTAGAMACAGCGAALLPPQYVPPAPQFTPPHAPPAPMFTPPSTQYAPPGTPAWGTAPPVASWQYAAPGGPTLASARPSKPPSVVGKVVGIVLAVVALIGVVAVAAVMISGTTDDRATGTSSTATPGAGSWSPADSDPGASAPAAPGETLPESPILDLFSGQWSAVTTSDGAFALELPGTPQRQSVQVPAAGGTIDSELIFSGNGDMNLANVGMLATTGDYGGLVSSKTISSSFDTFLKGVANGAVNSRHGTVTNTNRASSQIGPAGEFSGEFSSDGLVLHAFVTVHGTKMIALMVIVDPRDDAIGKLALAKAVASLHVG